MRTLVFTLTLLIVSIQAYPQGNIHAENSQDRRWGDIGDGTFANPVLNADYSDPDVIRVGDKYYMTCSEFHFMGMPILESEDMVNWKIINRVNDHIDFPEYSEMKRYAGGTWAPSLRYHDGKFWIFVCTPHEGLFMTVASDPRGEWSPLHQVKAVEKWEDPCPFWDEDGNAYLGRSQHGAGPIILHRMSPDGKSLLDDGVTIYEGPVAEGTKFYKKDGYYYLSIPEGGVGQGWQTVLRAKNIYGPYEGKRVLETGSTDVNGPHQGALVDTPEGEWWFYHFQETPVLGRVVHLQPVEWRDGFPVIGEDYDNNGIGEPMKICNRPNVSTSSFPYKPQTSDDFNANRLGIQWQYNHNPETDKISFSDGWLSLRAIPAEKLRFSRNQLTQKLMGYSGIVTTLLDYKGMRPGDCAGIESAGKKHLGVGVTVSNDENIQLYVDNDGEMEWLTDIPLETNGKVYLKYEYDIPSNMHRFFYSTDDEKYISIGEIYENRHGDWKGVRTGLYNYHIHTFTESDPGVALFDFFDYSTL